MNNTRIILTGAHGTGKTTVLNMFKEHGYPVITEVVRTLHNENGVKINEVGDDEGQAMIFDKYQELLSSHEPYVSDRGLTDVLAYTGYLYTRNCVSKNVLVDQLIAFEEFNRANKDVLYFYFPIEFEIEDDNVRSIDKEFQKEVDDNIKHTLHSYNINYHKVHGTPEERFQQILEISGIEL